MTSVGLFCFVLPSQKGKHKVGVASIIYIKIQMEKIRAVILVCRLEIKLLSSFYSPSITSDKNALHLY